MLVGILHRLIPHFFRLISQSAFIPLILVLSYPLISLGTDRNDCILEQAEACFNNLFDSMPICLGTELNFRCHHFKILDACFRKSSIMCSPAAIGQIAKAAHRRKVVSCVRQTSKQYRNAPIRRKVAPAVLRNHPPTELQFISLFGYLQSQCNTKLVENCTNHEYKAMLSSCEVDIKHKSGLANSDYDRQRLLKIKLDTSSQLLPLAETKREDECLIIRSALSDIFSIHQKYCFHTVVTKCMCERMNFQYFCDIECAALDSSGLPLDNRVSWENFKGKLVSGANIVLIKPVITFLIAYYIANRILLYR